MGQNKAQILCAGVPLLQRVVHQLKFPQNPFTPVYYIGDNIGGESRFILPDQYPGEGPLGALLTACAHMQIHHKVSKKTHSGWFLLASCDTLNIQAHELNQLTSALSRSKSEQLIAFKGEYWQPLWALYHVSIGPAAQNLFQEGRRSLQALFKSLKPYELLALDASTLDWWQINRPIDLKRAETLLKT